MNSAGLSIIDWAILLLYAGATIWLGWHFGKKQKSAAEFFTGSGKMNPLLIGVSLFASLLSTITYLSLPGEVTGKGPAFLIRYLSYPLVFLVVALVLLPVYMRQRVTSAYELLEEKLGVSVRLLGASMFLLLRLVWMSLLIFAAAKAFSYIIGADTKFIPLIVLAAGTISLIYASLGGLRAVVITDLMQTVLLFGGALLVIVMVTIQMNGFGWFPTRWQDHWDTQPIFSFDPRVRVTWVGTILSMFVWSVATFGGDQVSVQRFMATEDLKSAQKAIALNLVIAVVVGATLGLAGFAMLSYFQVNPQLLPADFSLKDNADDVFPRFIGFHLPVAASGLVAAGLFAAAMSSMDSGVNSITAVVSRDFVDRFRREPMSEAQHIRFARILTVIVGVVVLLGSSLVQHVPGNIVATTSKTVNLLAVPIFCLFLFALYFKNATPAGVWAGWFCGTTVAAAIAFSGPIVTLLATKFGVDPGVFGVELITEIEPKTGLEVTRAPDPISFQWITPSALAVNVLVGMLVSAITKKRTTNQS